MPTTHNFSSLSIHPFSTLASLSFSILRYILAWLLIFLTLNSSKTKFLFIGIPQQLVKINTSSLITAHSARNFGFIFDEHLIFSDQISALSKSCYYHIRELRCFRPYLDFKTASTIATSIVHSKLDYCNSQSQKKDSRTSRTLLLVLSPECQNLLTLLLFWNLYTASKWTNASNINSFL